MKPVVAYECSYCHEIFEWEERAEAHECKCYLNPETKSCASCAFLEIYRYKDTTGFSKDFEVCLCNIDISKKNLRTDCEFYIEAMYDDEYGDKLYTPENHFDKDLALKCRADEIEQLIQAYEQEQAVRLLKEAEMIGKTTPESETESSDVPTAF